MSNTVTYNEQELVLSLKAKDPQSFSYLYDNYAGALYSIVLQVVPDKELASDVLQEVFVNIWRKIESYDPTKGRLFTWMLNVARNLAIDMVRSKAYQNSQKNQSLPQTEYFDKSGISTQLSVDNIGLKKIVDKLKTEHRVLIDLAYFKGYTHEEIAEIESLPLGTVKTRIRSALIQLRDYLK
ncbi:MAG TPA: sigma-70 family RNA polymerase sigma factor [Chitinophagaceae bacterium]|nr:sigma-70 family RNA polymerase sigma factor [Chitinophagaceae bacterium]